MRPKVIRRSFTPFISSSDSHKLEGLIPALIHQFSSSAGYTLHGDAEKLLKFIRSPMQSPWKQHWNKIIVGVISNSDPRVPSILESFGLKVGPLYARRDQTNNQVQSDFDQISRGPFNETFDVQFTVLSYDAGIEKPNPAIYAVAENLVRESLLTEDERQCPLVKIYIGDEYVNDACASIEAGWDSILVDREAKFEKEYPQAVKEQKGLTMEWVPKLWPPNSYVMQDIMRIGRHGSE
jgi:hypothetical protein